MQILVYRAFRRANGKPATGEAVDVVERNSAVVVQSYTTDAQGAVEFYIEDGQYDFIIEGIRVPFDAVDWTGLKGDTGAKGDPGDLSPADSVAAPAGNLNLSGWTVPATKVRTLTGNATVTALPTSPGASTSGTITVVFKQAASGGPYTLAWPATLEWSGDAAAPTMPTVAGAKMVVHLFWDGTAWYGMLAGVYFP